MDSKRAVIVCRWKTNLCLGLSLICFLAAQDTPGQQPDEQIQKDIEALKESVKAIQKDVQDIKALLQSRQAPAAPPSNVILDPGRNPFKGDRNAPVTLVEFSDYQ